MLWMRVEKILREGGKITQPYSKRGGFCFTCQVKDNMGKPVFKVDKATVVRWAKQGKIVLRDHEWIIA